LSTQKNLDICTKSGNPILCFIIRRKLDQQAIAALENSADAPSEVPTLRRVLTFIERRACMLETSAQPSNNDSDGRYIVTILFTLGDSKKRAMSLFMNLKKKLKRIKKLR